ncbi:MULTISPECIES: DUF805 domain-containing protein [Asticcacaulis]|uniref:DUF805 domain-containing protein n=1 Tax=Asticcacaulis TaxID=76890 RepID=UPI001AE1CB13|nr:MULTISPECIES: DUF805 domain-containing protein [Asticcacaulis]MBP2158665.1 uncharacterized membrane protein YhaH (DUF805 family) [Asticcacaulis solisilvae]MDR6799711.1 uncharacterized membrane protein YhaH (DUF805 family) [Asticcacaulis sp. BE141]
MAKTATPLMFQPLVKYVDFNGRARRSEYWLFFLFQFLVSIALGLVGAIAGLKAPMEAATNLFSLAMFLPTLAVSVRRFHDINRTGWWVIFPLAVLIVALIIYFVFNGTAFIAAMKDIDMQAIKAEDETAIMDMFTALAPMFLWVWLPAWLASVVTFVFHVTDGTRGANRFGSDPKGASADAGVF